MKQFFLSATLGRYACLPLQKIKVLDHFGIVVAEKSLKALVEQNDSIVLLPLNTSVFF